MSSKFKMALDGYSPSEDPVYYILLNSALAKPSQAKPDQAEAEMALTSL